MSCFRALKQRVQEEFASTPWQWINPAAHHTAHHLTETSLISSGRLLTYKINLHHLHICDNSDLRGPQGKKLFFHPRELVCAGPKMTLSRGLIFYYFSDLCSRKEIVHYVRLYMNSYQETCKLLAEF